ncbi:MAG: CinA family nicotinamide mononucleotide deamidase-related protein [Chloroflexota bacterium]|nr:CinA family nicotinamide mononucleotide deamidase-related protein [Chloroflexota bacterium]
MADNPNAEIIAIGTELLLGEITDTNSVFMARQLRNIGVNIFLMTTVGDNLGRIAESIRAALGRAEIVITCGGLGPTVDDMTRQAVADAAERPLEFHQSLYDNIVERFRGFGVRMTANNRQQAYLPHEALLVENPVGTAPAFIVESDLGIIISLPGVPREMKYLLTESVVPYLLRKFDLGIIVARTLRTAGIGESSLDDMIGAEILNERNPSVGLAAHHGCVDIRLTAKAKSKFEAESLLDAMQQRLFNRVGDHIFGTGEATLEGVVSQMLGARQLSIHILEAGLPGVISERLDSGLSLVSSEALAHPGDLFNRLGRDPRDTTLRELAVDAVQHSRRENGSDACVVSLSYPDLDENADVEQGSAIAIATADGLAYRAYGFGARSALAQDWLSRWGLANLWRMLKDGN